MHSVSKGCKMILSDFDVSCFRSRVTWKDVLEGSGSTLTVEGLNTCDLSVMFSCSNSSDRTDSKIQYYFHK